MRDWEPITLGNSAARVHRSPDGCRFAKTAATPAGVAELADERDRLAWLAGGPIAAPTVLDWITEDGTATLVTSALPGIPASAFPRPQTPAVAARLVDFLSELHRVPTEGCPFDRRLAVTIPAATANMVAGRVDEDGFDAVEAGRRHAEELERHDLAVCHGDCCLPNVLLDPDTLDVTGILDVGRLGVADRHQDLALLTRSMSLPGLNPDYGAELATWTAHRSEADPWRIDYYRLLGDFL